MAADKSQEKQYINILLDETLLKRLDDFRFKHRFPSRTESVRWLLDWSLKQKQSPDRSSVGDRSIIVSEDVMSLEAGNPFADEPKPKKKLKKK